MADEPVQFASVAALPDYPSNIPCTIKTEKKSDRKSIGKEILEKVRNKKIARHHTTPNHILAPLIITARHIHLQ
jgi:hypothetical protein